MRYITRIILCICLFVNGCVEPYMPSVIVTDYHYLVIDGFLVGNDSTFITLSRTQTISDATTFEGEPRALVQIESESGKIYTLVEKDNGQYVAPALGLGLTDQYRLRIKTHNSHEYVSEYASIVTSALIDSVTFEEDREKDAIDFKIFAHDAENNSPYYLWTYDETWMYSAGYSVYYYQDGQMLPRARADEFYFCWKTLPGNNIYLHSTTALAADVVYDYHLFSIPQTSRKLYHGYSILVKQYALTREAYEYWTLTKKNSESLGGLFDPMPSQAASNFRCVSHPDEPVIGHFSASTVNKKRLLFLRSEIRGPSSGPYDPTGYEDCEWEILELKDISPETLQGKLVGDRYYDIITQELIGYTIAPEECVDCRFQGGTTNKPDYWR